MANLQLNHVCKSFNHTTVLHDINLTVDDGEFIVFVGPSGCGKSTLLRLIAGLETLSDGEICISNQQVNQLPPSQRGIAMVFQSYALYPHMTVAENMSIGLKIAGTPQHNITRKVAEVARTLQLENLLDRKPTQLSGGQSQRVAIGRAIVRDPNVFLFDEPLSNLDAELRVQMRLEISALHEKLKSTMIYVTHDQVEAMTMANRIVVLRAGRIEQVGTPLELYHQPVNQFVAGFIGSPKMNFIPLQFVQRDGCKLTVKLPNDCILQLTTEQPLGSDLPCLTLGIRPEEIELGAENDIALVLQITGNEILGGRCCLHATGPGVENLILETKNSARLPEKYSTVDVSFAIKNCYLFDHSGRAIRLAS